MATRKVYVSHDGKISGPFTPQEFKALVKKEKVFPDTKFCFEKDGQPSQQWRLARDIRGLFSGESAISSATQEPNQPPQETNDEAGGLTKQQMRVAIGIVGIVAIGAIVFVVLFINRQSQQRYIAEQTEKFDKQLAHASEVYDGGNISDAASLIRDALSIDDVADTSAIDRARKLQDRINLSIAAEKAKEAERKAKEVAERKAKEVAERKANEEKSQKEKQAATRNNQQSKANYVKIVAAIAQAIETGQLRGGGNDPITPSVEGKKIKYWLKTTPGGGRWSFHYIVAIGKDKHRTICVRPQDIPQFKRNLSEMLKTAYKIQAANIKNVEKDFNFNAHLYVASIPNSEVVASDGRISLYFYSGTVGPYQNGGRGGDLVFFSVQQGAEILNEIDMKTVELFQTLQKLKDL